MPKLTVAAAQIAATIDPSQNLEIVRDYARQAAEAGSRITVFPEATMARFGTRLSDIAQPLDGPFGEGVRSIAQELGMWLVVGMFEPAEDKVFNTLLATDGSSEVVYRKRHLFDAFGQNESDYVQAGFSNCTFTLDDATVGLATCYDLRFAHQFTELGLAGAHLVCVPACWASGPDKSRQWQLLIGARAMDAQSFLLAVDQAYQPKLRGAANGIGESCLLNPLGKALARLESMPDLLVTEIDLDMVEKVRQNIPVLAWQRNHK